MLGCVFFWFLHAGLHIEVLGRWNFCKRLRLIHRRIHRQAINCLCAEIFDNQASLPHIVTSFTFRHFLPNLFAEQWNMDPFHATNYEVWTELGLCCVVPKHSVAVSVNSGLYSDGSMQPSSEDFHYICPGRRRSQITEQSNNTLFDRSGCPVIIPVHITSAQKLSFLVRFCYH